MVDFGGWDMPVEYSGITAEHMAVRTAVGLFDVSHMGDIQFRGQGSLAAVQTISMNDASRLAVGQAHYSAMLYPQGTFVDDILVHKFGENDYLLVINAGTREKDFKWVRSQVGAFPGVHVSDYSDYFTQLAIQGPRAQDTLAKLTKADWALLRTTGLRGVRCAEFLTCSSRAPATPAKMALRSISRPTRDQRPCMGCGDRSRPGVWLAALRPGSTQHSPSGIRNGSLWPRNL